MAGRSKINLEKAWEILFERHNIPERVQEDGAFHISSTEINTVKEARLMAKFDQSAQLPQIFKDNQLSILPVTRGEYVIGSFRTHLKIEYPEIVPQPVVIPNLQSLDYTNLYSESAALLFAYNSGIIQDIMGASAVNFTVNGRISSGSFDYHISNLIDPTRTQNISVQNAQVEIDAGYESNDAFCICEAKNIASQEILIRQLYYPYRLWRSKIVKPVIPVFLVYSNDVFHAFIYEFEDLYYYNSIRLLQHKAYTFADEEIHLQEVIDLWKSIKETSEPGVTFPQADSFARVMDLLSVLYEKDLTPDEVTLKYEFDSRQTNYYIAACEYLGFINRGRSEEGEVLYKLSSDAHSIMGLRYKAKYLEIIKRILKRPVFNRTFQIAIQIGDVPNKKTVCNIMQEANLNISGETIGRRSSTARSWIDWILRQTETE